ncbi:helix-turn-helix domain-containing protein [Tannockella kyphosi]|uniref:helix-turn-helix domain-containing protein n=1 Tax=Tannockella kyphosi TaxID=2899121 RepID=UPI0020125FB5|nr:helix-turn-helix transcriptional regulator [Tannockella kyphosi]
MKNVDDVLALFEDYVDDADIMKYNLIIEVTHKIMEERISQNMSQKEFAEKLGISQSMISKIESEQYNFTLEMLAKIFTKLDYTVELRIDKI